MAAGEARRDGVRADAIDDLVAASVPVVYLTAQVTPPLADFKPGRTVLAPGIGGSVGNATYQLARAQGAGTVIRLDRVHALVASRFGIFLRRG